MFTASSNTHGIGLSDSEVRKYPSCGNRILQTDSPPPDPVDEANDEASDKFPGCGKSTHYTLLRYTLQSLRKRQDDLLRKSDRNTKGGNHGTP